MRQKEKKVIISFHTTTEAMKMDRRALEKGFPGRLIPIPREITAGCGLAWMAPPESRELLEDGMKNEEIVYDRIYLLEI